MSGNAIVDQFAFTARTDHEHRRHFAARDALRKLDEGPHSVVEYEHRSPVRAVAGDAITEREAGERNSGSDGRGRLGSTCAASDRAQLILRIGPGSTEETTSDLQSTLR